MVYQVEWVARWRSKRSNLMITVMWSERPLSVFKQIRYPNWTWIPAPKLKDLSLLRMIKICCLIRKNSQQRANPQSLSRKWPSMMKIGIWSMSWQICQVSCHKRIANHMQFTESIRLEKRRLEDHLIFLQMAACKSLEKSHISHTINC